MRINHNLTAMNTHRQLGVTASSQAKSMEKLSSGYRINRAGDDAAGLAISEKMRAQIRGLNQASRNAQDGISMIQTFEGGLNETHSILQRMRELAVQSANDVNTDSDRLQINNEIGQLKLEVDRIANNTEFNTMNMMNYGATLNAAGFSDVSQAVVNSLNIKIPEWINDSMVAINTRFGIDYPDSPVLRDMAIVYVDDPTAGYAATMATSDAGQSLTLTINLDSFTDASGDLVDEQLLDGLLAHEVMHAFQYTEMSQLLGGGLSDEETWFVEGLSMLVQGGNSWVSSIPGGLVGADISGTFGNTQEEYASAFVALKTLHEITVGGIGAIIDQLEDGTSSLNDAIAATAQTDQGEASGSTVANYTTFGEFIAAFNAGNFDDYFTNSGTTDFTLGTGAITDAATAGSSSNLSLADTIPNNTGIDKVYAHFDLSFATGSGATTADNTTDEVVLQIGANQGQTMAVAAFDATSNGLGIGSVNVATQLSSDRAITTLDTAIKTVSSIRARLGAVQNRLEHTISNLDNTSENLQGAESRIRDVDMAKEMMAFTKYNILQQAGQSMLAQANQRPQMILALLQA